MRRARVENVMTRPALTAREDAPYKELVRLMAEHRVSGLPVVDEEGRLVGIVTEADLLLAEEGEPKFRSLFLQWFTHPTRLAALKHEAEGIRAAHIMTRSVVTVRPHETVHDAAKVLLDAGVKRLPVVDEEHRVVGIVSRCDLLRPYLRSDREILDEVREDVVLGTMWIDPRTVKVEVKEGVVRLEGRLERKSVKELMVELVHRVDGVTGVDDHLTFEADDRTVRPIGPYGPRVGRRRGREESMTDRGVPRPG